MIDKRTKKRVDRVYKAWLEEQCEEDPILTATCIHCQQEINLGDGGFMSWSYAELSEHMQICEYIDRPNQRQTKPKGFDDNGRNYGYSG